MNSSSVIILSREVEAIQIPSGQKNILPPGASVIITQDLGGTYTVAVQGQPGLYRILAKDADALGKKADAATSELAPAKSEGPVNEEAVWEQLRTCYDPEIPVNIVDLGLIYSMEIKPQDAGGNSVEVKMTLTAPGCGMGPSIAADAQSKILGVPGVTEARVDLVWDPPWSSDRISPEGKAKLGMA
jgi:probable FeS assembly SUF system protein SufT